MKMWYFPHTQLLRVGLVWITPRESLGDGVRKSTIRKKWHSRSQQWSGYGSNHALFMQVKFLCLINLRGLFNNKPIFLEGKQCYYLTHCWGMRRFITFPEDISPKVNVVARLEFELVYDVIAVQHVSPNIDSSPFMLANTANKTLTIFTGE